VFAESVAVVGVVVAGGVEEGEEEVMDAVETMAMKLVGVAAVVGSVTAVDTRLEKAEVAVGEVLRNGTAG